MTMLAHLPDVDEVDALVHRALVYVKDGELRAVVLERLARLHGLGVEEQLRAAEMLRSYEVRVRHGSEPGAVPDTQPHLEQSKSEEEPSGPELGLEDDARHRSTEQLEACVAKAAWLLADRRLGHVGRHRVLTADEEVGLAVLMRAPGWPLARELPSGHRSALRDASDPARAFDALVEHNMRLVWSVSRGYGDQLLEWDDVRSSGMFGLLRAAEKFDATKGFKFSTYATWWIRQSITRAIANESAAIRLPVHLVEQINRMRGVWRRLEVERGRVGIADVAAALGLPSSRVLWLINVSKGTYSLDQPLATASRLTLADVLPDEGDLAEDFDRSEATRAIDSVLGTLTDREADVMRRRYGLTTGEVETLDEVGQHYGLTRERIRQIQEKTLTKLRHPRRSQPLITFYRD